MSPTKGNRGKQNTKVGVGGARTRASRSALNKITDNQHVGLRQVNTVVRLTKGKLKEPVKREDKSGSVSGDDYYWH